MEIDNSNLKVSKNPFLEIANLVLAQRYSTDWSHIPGAEGASRAAIPNFQALSDLGHKG